MQTLSRRLLITAIAGAMTISTVLATRSAGSNDSTIEPARQNWALATGDLGNRRYSALSQINTETVKNLGAAWIIDKFDDAGTSRVTPVVNDGVMFLTAGAKVYALDAKTGNTVWKFETTAAPLRGGMGPGSPPGHGIPNSEGVAVSNGKVFVGTSDAQMIALDEKTGNQIWRRTVGDDIIPIMQAKISSAPIVSNGVVYTSISFDEGRYIGRALALDAKDGHQIWRWNSVPGPGEPGHETWTKDPKSIVWTMGGANVWLPAVVDPELGLVYYGTGNPSPNRVGDVRPGNNLYSCSIVALDIKTGKLRWYYQTTHHDLWEGDIAQPIVLYDAQINGTLRKGVAALRPDGTMFLIDRATGKPLYPIEERPVRQNSLYQTSPTQPFPAGAGSVIERDCSHWSPMNGFVVRCEFFQPPTNEPPNVLNYAPSTRSSPMSFSPQTGYFYLQGIDKLTWQWNSPDPSSWEFGVSMYLSQKVPNIDKNSVMIFAALDPKTYKVIWKKEMRAPSSTYGVGGFLTTGGGLAFHRLEDGNLAAFDAKTGDELWKFQTGVLGTDTGTPMTYEADGQQYVAVTERSQLWAFRLGGKLPPAPAPELPFLDDVLKGPIQDAQTIQVSAPDVYNYRHDITPMKTRVKAGTQITFTNNGAGTHTMVAEDGSWTTTRIMPRQIAIMTFDKPGTYLYHCKEHPWSYGMIIVTDAGSANGAAPANGSAQAGQANFAVQAGRGKDAYMQQCSTCHQADLSGNDMIPGLAGPGFLARWAGKTGKDLLDRTRTTMPSTAPGSLSPQAYLDLVAYLLQVNGISQPRALSAETVNAVTLH